MRNFLFKFKKQTTYPDGRKDSREITLTRTSNDKKSSSKVLELIEKLLVELVSELILRLILSS